MNTSRIYQLHISDLVIDVVKKDIKNMHLGVYPPAGRVRIAAPLRISEEAIRLFAVSKIAWIKRQKLKFNNQPRQPRREYVSGESHYFMGKRYLLKVINHSAPPKVELPNKSHISLYIRQGSGREKREAIMTEWYRAQLKRQIPNLIEKWQKVLGIRIKDWGVKRMRTRWGTCSLKSRRIWVNLELAKKTQHCSEFIIAHELVHFLEKSHNDQFKLYMDKFMPRWHQYKEELNRSILSHEKWSY